MENQNIITTENSTQEFIKTDKKKSIIKKIIKYTLIALPILVILFGILDTRGVFPDNEKATKKAVFFIENFLEVRNGSTIEKTEFASVDYKKLKGKIKDEFGFYDDVLNTPITSDGISYENYVKLFEEKYNKDIFKLTKYIYTVKGTCTIKSKNGNLSEKDFTIIIAHIPSVSYWFDLNRDTMFSSGKSVKELAKDEIRISAALMWDGVKGCRVEVTETVDMGYKGISVYGKVYITDHYGDEYESRFDALYKFDYDELTYKKEEINISTPVRT